MAIVDASGTAVVSYAYDAWGNILSVTGTMADTLGESNPLRYRGYVYDQETKLYYLQSRYYDPEVGRFINADALVSTGQGILGNNMFAYCRNNPVNRKDASGTEDVCATDFNQDDNPLNDLGNPSGSGSGVKSGKLTFKSEADLNKHFEKHNPEFENKFKTPQEYADAANDVIQNGEYIANQNAYVQPYGTNGFVYYSFVGLTHDHSFITTFHLKHVTRIRF